MPGFPAADSRGFRNLAMWSRGVEAELFRPRHKVFLKLPRPVWLHFGRVAVEKDFGDFLRLDLPGSKLVVGDGVTGVLSEDLRTAALAALELDPAACRELALLDTWEAATHQILDQLAPCRSD